MKLLLFIISVTFSSYLHASDVRFRDEVRKTRKIQINCGYSGPEAEVIQRFGRIGQSKNSLGFRNTVKEAIESSIQVNTGCLANFQSVELDFFYDIDTSGKASKIYWYPESIDANCLKVQFEKIEFPKPEYRYYGYWNIKDDVHG